MKQMIVATKNEGKAAEFKTFFSRFGIESKSLLDLDGEIPHIEETGTTFIENAKLKAEGIAAFFNRPVIADDSGLLIDALNGNPGIYSARYAGDHKNDKDNMDKVLEELAMVKRDERSARFIAVLAIAIPGEETIFREGFCEGTISFEIAGTEGFGYDPIFIPQGYSKTMAQLTRVEKNQISHRSQAFKQLEKWIMNTKFTSQ